jgi:hypothetical protein
MWAQFKLRLKQSNRVIMTHLSHAAKLRQNSVLIAPRCRADTRAHEDRQKLSLQLHTNQHATNASEPTQIFLRHE